MVHSTKMDVSIVMINYNTYELTKAAIESIFRYTANILYEIILVDNDSPDRSGDKLRDDFANKITYVQSSGNLGTSKAFNIGLKKASGKYVLWMNTDILLHDNFIFILYDYMEKHPDCGICGGNLIGVDNLPTHSFRMRLPSLKTVKNDMSITRRIFNKLLKNAIKREYNFSNNPIEVGYITGADMMIRKDVIDEIGGFDEDIFMYAEECEFTFRMKKHTQYKVISVPNAVMQHLEGASFGKSKVFNERRFRAILNGNSVYFDKCYGNKVLTKYLKLLSRSYRKFEIISTLIFDKEKKAAYRLSRKIVQEKIRETSVL